MARSPGGPSGLTAWTTPSSLLGIFGFVAIVYGGYLAFQENVGEDISDLRTRVVALETTVKNHEKQIDRLDRLEDRRRERGE